MSTPAAPPPPLSPGDRVGVAGLSGPVDPTALEAGVDALREAGLEPVLASNLGSAGGRFAGEDRERVEGFEALVRDPKLKAIFFARGGYGILRLLPMLDWKALAAFPKAYVGYSDVTPFLNLVVERLGLIAFHGPMVAVEWAQGLEPAESDSLWRLLSGELDFEMPVAGGAGAAEGILRGGCLSLLASTSGTDFAPRLDDSVLFWEDVTEPLYRLDRMLTQLRLSGSLSRINAMVAGCIESLESECASEGLPVLLGELGAELSCPTAWGLTSGHVRPNLTLPLGARVSLNADQGVLRSL